MEATAGVPTYAQVLSAGEVALREARVPTARLDAEVLLSTAMQATSRTALYAHLHEEVPAAVGGRFLDTLERRCRREPVAYITGVQEFWSLPFKVTPAVLIPRPETELLVEAVCERIADRLAASVCEVGTGSGCVAIAVARGAPAACLTAIDVSSQALRVARENARVHGVGGRVAFVCADLFTAFAPLPRFDVIVSNPPYLGSEDRVASEVAWEPAVALAAGVDGLAVIERLIEDAASHLRGEGWLIMEFGCGQETAVRELARGAGFRDVSIEPDLAAIPRMLVARKRGQATFSSRSTA